MENASKALIMAGAVLIAIVLISVGVAIVAQSRPVTDTTKEAADTIALKTFNSTFEKYLGTKKGSEIKELQSDVNINNTRNPDKAITLTLPTGGINPYANYQVSVATTNGYVNGYIKNIVVSTAP